MRIASLLLFIGCWCCCLLVSCRATATASFYGASYVHVPLQDAKSTTDIHFRFKTKRSDSFLLLAAGRTDYCMIRLESGKLKVHINLGAGESEVSSARGLKLDDLNWHDVSITRRDAEFVLVVDNIHITKEKLPGRFFELNIHYGLFLGGQGDFSELFLGHHDSLRGCLSDVDYNGVNLLKKARERIGMVDVQGVTWTCSPEFEAGVDRDISFVENGAFLTLANHISRTGTRWEFDIKTMSSDGLLLYNTGLTSRSDYLGVELVEGRVRLIVDRGNGASELMSDHSVADGFWHSVSVHFTPTLLEVIVDGNVSSIQLTPGGSRDLDLGENLFIGGMELNKRARALGQGIKSADVSIKGCLRNVTFDGRRTGIPDAKVTQGLLPDCIWEYHCTRNPCVDGAVCFQQGVESFRCECEQSTCVKTDYADKYKIYSRTSLPIDLEIVRLVPVVTEEGKNALITTDNIDVVLDYRKYGVRDSGLLLRILEPPQHGKILVDNWDKHGISRQVFTLLDVSKDKIRYIHDGAENHHDRISFDLELSPESGFLLPSYLQGKHRFVLHVNVTPVNDPPVLELGTGKVLRLAQGTRKILTKDLLDAEDPDSSTNDLVYTVLNQGGRTEEKGFVERIGKPGVRIDTFTQREIDNGIIAYVHRGKEGNPNSRLALQVSDGIETSPPAFLRISSFPLQIRLQNNTGIILTHKSAVKITPFNLTFATNADDPTLEIRYEVVKPPQYGVIERLRGPETGDGTQQESLWLAVDHFTSLQIAREEIRYRHTNQSPPQDLFKFRVSVTQVKNPTEYDFRITFTKLVLEPVKIKEVFLNGTKDATITERELEYVTRPLQTPKKNIVFKLIKGPKYGFLHLLTNKRRHLQGGDIFTQEDIESERLRYRLHRRGYSHIRDDFIFQTSAPEAKSTPRSLTIIHTPTPKTRNEVHVTLEGLQVDEGGRQVLLPTHLDLRASVITSLVYNITHGPQHGWIDVMNKSSRNILRRNTTFFTSEELLSERVYYNHDDSETRRDRFNFVALSSEEEDFQFVGEFHVNVILKNDNTPTRTVDKVFNVVTNGERLLTGRDLMYSDADIDTKPSGIAYTRRGIPNGGLYWAEEPTKAVFEFTQENLNDGKILFRHEGEEYGKIGLWITDGQYYANGILEIKASPPYVTIINNTNLIVQHGGVTTIGSDHLSAETNLNSRDDMIVYDILDGPEHGYVMILPDGEPLTSFTQLDLEEGRLSYNHDGGSSVKDSFKFRVTAQDVIAEETFHIRVYPASFWEDLTSKNGTLYVEESTSAVIGNDVLEVMHPSIAPSDIIFYVTKQPSYGSLEIDSGFDDGKDEAKPPIKMFEQSTINDNRLHYVQEIANRTDDSFTVDATNGITWVRGLTVAIIVIPEVMYIAGGSIQCLEGDSVQLPALLFTARNDYYRGKVTDYKIYQKPKNGAVRYSRYPDTLLTKFSRQQLDAGLIQYTHDGSETSEDEFFVVGRAGDKESLPAEVKITVLPVNDRAPFIVNNTGLELWEGSSSIITSSRLAVADEDTSAKNIIFTVTSVKTGHLALVSNPNKPIQEFTQEQVNENQILFVQKGGQSGRFQFQFSDGESTSEQMTFHVTAKLVEIRPMVNKKLNIFPMLKKVITSDSLLCVTSDYTTSRGKSITYVVTKRPQHGKLLLYDPERDGYDEVERFTQAEVNDSKVWYQHTERFKNVLLRDGFGFDVHAEFTKPLTNQMFDIDVSVSSGGLDQFLEIPNVHVKEGGSRSLRINTTKLTTFLLTKAGLDSPDVEIHVARRPRHGSICLKSTCNATMFTREQANRGEISYQHDDSDSTQDEVTFSVILIPGDVLLSNVTCNITIQPVNDQPFSIVTLSPQLSVVQGQRHVLTPQDLLTEDADTPPEEIVYDIINGPSQGYITLLKNKTADKRFTGRFTQSDINSGKVVYQHSGSMQPTSFYFRVSDGYFNPTYTVFNIHVLPLTLNASSPRPVYLQQCSSATHVDPENIRVETNGDPRNVNYNVTRNPKYGVIYLGNSPTNHFTQSDLDSKQIAYMQTIMTAPGDTFQLSVWIIETESPSTVDLTVMVRPLLTVGTFSPVVGSKNRLSVAALDASPLARITNNNPMYEVLRKPRLGRLKKIIRSSGEKKNIKEREISKFTHEEVKSGVIYYVVRKSIVADEYNNMEDSMLLQSEALICQPAKVELKFKVYPEGSNVTATVLGAAPTPPRNSDPRNPVGHESGITIASPNIKNDYILIVGMVLGVLLLAIAVIVIVRCKTVHKQERRSSKSDLQMPLPLPRPPDDLMPSSPRIKRFSSSNGSTPNSIPQCKVIPLGPIDSITGSDLEINSRYPYGMSDEPAEDWSSYDTSETGYPPRSTNPMLRRNQYWV